jgi:hypothetical protein
MMTTLLLTATEKPLWDKLPAKLREGWEVVEERGAFRDSPERRTMRLQLVHLRDPKLKIFLEKARAATSVDALATLVLSMDLREVMDADLAELFFALGPALLAKVMSSLLQSARTDSDIEGIAALTVIRNALYSSTTASP